MNEKFYNELIDILTEKCVKINENLARYTTFKIGGPADYFVTIKKPELLGRVLRLCASYDMPYYVIGKGSNLLVSDKGYRGVIIKLVNPDSNTEYYEEGSEEFDHYVRTYGLSADSKQTIVRVFAGCSLITFGIEVARAGYTGFEFATGVPGSVGGAVAMNAGAYGQEIKDTILEVRAVDKEGNLLTLGRDQLNMGYRSCIIQEKEYIVVDAVFAFKEGDREEILATVADLSKRRQEKQPLEFPSAGSTFKRPEGYFAGKLIMDAGLRGYQYGGARVSDKHCGFVINAGDATAEDVLSLVKHVQDVVMEQFGVELKTEIKMLGEF